MKGDDSQEDEAVAAEECEDEIWHLVAVHGRKTGRLLGEAHSSSFPTIRVSCYRTQAMSLCCLQRIKRVGVVSISHGTQQHMAFSVEFVNLP